MAVYRIPAIPQKFKKGAKASRVKLSGAGVAEGTPKMNSNRSAEPIALHFHWPSNAPKDST